MMGAFASFYLRHSGHREAMSPESKTTTGIVDFGPAPSAASRNDDGFRAYPGSARYGAFLRRI
jgi:hypothetical protein